MIRLKPLDPEQTTGKSKELFNAIHAKLGVVPNMMRTMGHSPALLRGYLELSSALSGGALSAGTGTMIALAVAQSNECNYCLSAHTYLGANLNKLDTETMESARLGSAHDPKIKAILKFAQILIRKKGRMADTDVASVREAGASESEIVEIIGHVALNILTNYFNNTANTEIDFPVVEAQILTIV